MADEMDDTGLLNYHALSCSGGINQTNHDSDAVSYDCRCWIPT